MANQRKPLTGIPGDFTRRNFFKGLAGIAGLSLIPTAAPAQGLRNRIQGDILWDVPMPANYAVVTGTYYGGQLILSIQSHIDGSGAVLFLDVQNQQLRGPYPVQGGAALGRPLITSDEKLWVSDSDHLFQVDPATGNVLQSVAYSLETDPVAGPDNVMMFITSAGRIVSVDSNGVSHWSYDTSNPVQYTAVAPVIAPNGIAVAAIDQKLYACQPGSTNPASWTYTAETPITGPLAVDAENVYFSTTGTQGGGQRVSAIDLATGNLKWQWPNAPLGHEISGILAVGSAIYFYDASGLFHALKPDGTQLWPALQLSAGSTGVRIFAEDGVAYVTALDIVGNSTLWAVDLANQRAISQTSDVSAYFAGVENGVAYFIHNYVSNVAAINFAGQLHQFYCESELMVEDYTSSSNGYQGNTTSYRTHLQMLDDTYNPRVAKAVKVWASGPAVLSSGGNSFNIDNSGNNAYLQTDGGGELSLVVTASDLSCPALYIWSNFMASGECLVIYPDHYSLNTLSSTTGSSLSQATTYDGTPMLPTGYSSANDLASTITSTIGGGTTTSMSLLRRKVAAQLASAAGPSGPPRRPRPAPPPGSPNPPISGQLNSYIAYPNSSQNLVYQPVIGPSDRPYGNPTVPNWTTEFNGNEVAYTVDSNPQLITVSEGLGIEDLLKNVVHGAEQVGKIVYRTASNIVTTLIYTAENTYSITVAAVEHAAAIVAATLKTVIGDIKKAIQWLSYLFDWDAILATKDEIKGSVTQGFSNLLNWISLQKSTGYAGLHSGLQGLDMNSSLSEGQQQIGSGSFQSQQVNNNDPQQLYGMGGDPSNGKNRTYTKSRYLTTKVTDNASGGSVSTMLNARLVADSSFTAAVEAFLSSARSTMLNDSRFSSIPTDLKNTFSSFSLLLTNPSQFASRSFGDIIQIIHDIAASLVTFTDAIVEGLLTLLENVISAIANVFQSEIHIPVVSDLWQLISKSPLTLLDLVSLMIAVPATLINDAVNGLSSGLRTAANVTKQQIMLFSAQGLQAFMVPTGDALGKALGPFYTVVLAALATVVFGLQFPSDFAANTTYTYVYYCLKSFPVVLTIYNLAELTSTVAVTIRTASPFIVCGFGFLMLSLGIGFGVAGEKGFSGAPKIVQNSFATFPAIGRPFAVGPPADPNRLALMAVDAVGLVTSLFIAIVHADG